MWRDAEPRPASRPDIGHHRFRQDRPGSRESGARLRSAIASNINDYRSTQAVFVEPIGNYRRLLFETLPGRSYYDYRVRAGATDAADIVASIEAFRSDPRFEAAANAEITYGSDVLLYIREFTQRSEQVLSLLQAGE